MPITSEPVNGRARLCLALKFTLLTISLHCLHCNTTESLTTPSLLTFVGGGAVLCIGGCIAESLASTHWLPVALALHPCDTTKISPDIAECFLKDKVALVENHFTKGKLRFACPSLVTLVRRLREAKEKVAATF